MSPSPQSSRLPAPHLVAVAAERGAVPAALLPTGSLDLPAHCRTGVGPQRTEVGPVGP